MKQTNKKPKKENETPKLQHIEGNPETANEMINKYGTYNIQPTADTENAFPKIAQGLPNKKFREKD